MRISRVKRNKTVFKSKITNFNNIAIITMAVVFLLGIIVGAIILNTMSSNSLSQISSSWNMFLETTTKPNMFESFSKYAKIISLIWVFGFFKFGAVGIISVLFWKGMSVGFTSSFIVASTGSMGIIFISKLYLLQTTILIPLSFALGIIAVKFSLRKLSPTYLTHKKYCLLGLIQLMAILILSLIDCLIV